MNQAQSFSVKATVELIFVNSHTREISYAAFSPELDKLQTKRSFVKMEKKDKSLIPDLQKGQSLLFFLSGIYV